jgi:hypothetical protein
VSGVAWLAAMLQDNCRLTTEVIRRRRGCFKVFMLPSEG